MSTTSPQIPKTFGERFERGAVIARRPRTSIFEARDNEQDTGVVLKVFHARPGHNVKWQSDFVSETRTLQRVEQKHAVKVLGGGYEEGWLYLVTEFNSGISLREFIKKHQAPLDVDSALSVICQIADAVVALHEVGYVHRAIDSRAILCGEDKCALGGYRPRVLELIENSQRDKDQLVIGSAYQAPEVREGGVGDECSDVFSLAAVLFELLSAKRPFPSSTPLAIAMRKQPMKPRSVARFNPEVTPLLTAVLEKALDHDPQKRFATMLAFVEALMGWGIGSAVAYRGLPETEPLMEEEEKLEEVVEDILPAVEDDESAQETVTDSAAYTVGSRLLDDDEGDPTTLRSDAEPAWCSLLALTGTLRGKRYWCFKNPSTLGSKSDCDVKIASIDVPAKAALLSKSDGGYSVTMIADNKASLKGKVIESSQGSVALERGSIIEFGSLKLRFIPTLKKAESSTSDDLKPENDTENTKTQWRAGIWLLGTIAFVLAVVFAYLW